MSNLTEEQQIEQLKDWWKDNGTPIMVGAVLALSGFFGWKYVSEKEIAYQHSASTLFVTVTDALDKSDKTKVGENALAVKTQYPDTSYAVLSAFHLAKLAVEEKDLDKAVEELDWVLENHASSELAPIAKIRLARIYIAQQKAEQALELLSFPNDSGYFEIASLVKGHALKVLGRNAEALEAYRAAQSAGKVTAGHPTLNIIIDELASSEISLATDTLEMSQEETEQIEETSETQGAGN